MTYAVKARVEKQTGEQMWLDTHAGKYEISWQFSERIDDDFVGEVWEKYIVFENDIDAVAYTMRWL